MGQVLGDQKQRGSRQACGNGVSEVYIPRQDDTIQQDSDPGMGEPGNGQDPSAGTADWDRWQTSRVPEMLIIQHADPQLTIQQKTHIAGKEQVMEVATRRTEMQGNTNKNAGYRWFERESHNSVEISKPNRLSKRRIVMVTEVRSLSPDRRTMTLEIESSGGEMGRRQTLMCDKQWARGASN